MCHDIEMPMEHWSGVSIPHAVFSVVSSDTGTVGSKGSPLSSKTPVYKRKRHEDAFRWCDTEQQGVPTSFIVPSARSRLIMNEFPPS